MMPGRPMSRTETKGERKKLQRQTNKTEYQ